MIYFKDSVFSYPILSELSNDYKREKFFLNSIKINYDEEVYKLNFDEIELTSVFLKDLIKEKKAKIILIVKTKDNQFFDLDYENKKIDISKKELSLEKNNELQLMIIALEKISLESNLELQSFYDNLKKDIVVEKNSILAFSEVIKFFGDEKKPLEMFERKVDSNIKSDIKIDITPETIVIVYKSKEFQPKEKELNYPYVYIGLQRALTQLILDNGTDKEYFQVDINYNYTDTPLYSKLVERLIDNNIDELNFNNIDEVIAKIAPDIIKKYTKKVEEINGKNS